MHDEYEDYDFEDIELYEHKRSDKVKWIVSFLLIFVLLAGLIGAWAMLLEDRFKPEEGEKQEEVIEEKPEAGSTAEVKSVALAMQAAEAANGGVSKELTATVYPSDARNKAVDWTPRMAGYGKAGRAFGLSHTHASLGRCEHGDADLPESV